MDEMDDWITPETSAGMADLSRMTRQFGDGRKPGRTNRSSAAMEGTLAGASANFRDEVYGASEASGLPGWLGGFRAPIGAARLGYEALAGRGPATERYEEGRDRARDYQKAAQEEFPGTYIAGELAGAVAAPMGKAALLDAPTRGARMLQGAKIGAGYGAASGAGAGEDWGDRASGAVTGGLVGGGLGAAGAPVAEGLASGVNSVRNAVTNKTARLRSAADPETEAARRIVTGMERDRQTTGRLSVTPEEAEVARLAGQNLTIMDLGGETTRALARSAANTSPEARNILYGAIDPRYESQGFRAGEFIRNLVETPADAARTREAFDIASKTKRGPFYDKAYADGAKGIWDAELENMVTAAPPMKAIMEEASRSIQTKMASGKSVEVATTDGVPTLAYWDQVKRIMDDKIRSMKRNGDKEGAGDLSALRRMIVQKADDATRDPKTGVSSYEVARGVSSELFKATDAVEAGEKFFSSTMRNSEARRSLSKMNPEEKTLFAEGYASALYNKIQEVGFRRDIVKSIIQSPAARERLEIALGPKAAKEMETFLRIEAIMDRARDAMGNSKTAQYLTELGMAGAGGAAGGFMSGDLNPASNPAGWIAGALLSKGARGLGNRIVREGEQKTAIKIAEMLTSSDPAVLKKGIEIVSKSPAYIHALRNFDRHLASMAGQQSQKATALLPAGTVAGRAEDNEP